MPRRKETFANGEIYHITTRRIGDKLLFRDINDYYRGIFSIYEFNTIHPIEIKQRRKMRAKIKVSGVPDSDIVDSRDPLVEIFLFSFMPNHIHLLLKQLKEGGISKFMNKFGSGYPAYFREKNNQREKGYFFQNRFVSVHIKTEEQLKTVFVYVHTNPIALIEPHWKEQGIKNPEKAIKFLENYKWSSYQDYIGKKNFPSVTKRELLSVIMGGEQGCRDFVESWIRYKGEIKKTESGTP